MTLGFINALVIAATTPTTETATTTEEPAASSSTSETAAASVGVEGEWILGFGLVVLGLIVFLQWMRLREKGGRFSATFARVFGLTFVGLMATLLAIEEVPGEARTAAFTLLGTIAGYFVGGQLRSETPSTTDGDGQSRGDGTPPSGLNGDDVGARPAPSPAPVAPTDGNGETEEPDEPEAAPEAPAPEAPTPDEPLADGGDDEPEPSPSPAPRQGRGTVMQAPQDIGEEE